MMAVNLIFNLTPTVVFFSFFHGRIGKISNRSLFSKFVKFCKFSSNLYVSWQVIYDANSGSEKIRAEMCIYFGCKF